MKNRCQEDSGYMGTWRISPDTLQPVLTGLVQQTFVEKMVLVVCSLAAAGAAQPDVASC